MATNSIEQLIIDVQSLDRPALTDALLSLQSGFPMDFSREFLDKCSEEKLRHILLAACLYTRRNHSGVCQP